MNKREYHEIIESAERLDRSLFDLSTEENLDRLEGILMKHSERQGETMIAVPLVQPYGGPVCEYIVLPERLYREMRTAMESGEVSHVPLEIGVPYDKKRLDINREQVQHGFKIPQEYIEFMEKIRGSAIKVVMYKKPPISYCP